MAAPTVVILAAGHGTRMRSATPKVLHEVCGRPMIAWPVRAALDAGASRLVVVEGPDRALDGRLPEEVELAVQAEPRGTGDAVRSATAHLSPDAPVIVLAGDVPLITSEAIAALAAAHEASGAAATMATMELDDPSGYGRVVRGLDALERLRPDNAQAEYYLPDVLPLLHGTGAGIQAFVVDDPTLMLGVNDRVDLAGVRRLAQQRIHEGHMRAGVTIVDPSSTLIDADVELGADTVVEPATFLRGSTRAGERCRLGPLSTLIDSTLADEVSVAHSYLDGCEARRGVTIGPFAYLRPGTLLRPRARAGTFVEIKNSDIGEGTKVPHLSYVGDADVGEDSNLGAGTITANYDGVQKHRTRVGSRVRGGVDTSLVAPVEVGDAAWTAAGSVITEDVPPGALGIARARQRNVEGYDERRRDRG